jgi:hypothetical protein
VLPLVAFCDILNLRKRKSVLHIFLCTGPAGRERVIAQRKPVNAYPYATEEDKGYGQAPHLAMWHCFMGNVAPDLEQSVLARDMWVYSFHGR